MKQIAQRERGREREREKSRYSVSFSKEILTAGYLRIIQEEFHEI
jgi:hypothetical protein